MASQTPGPSLPTVNTKPSIVSWNRLEPMPRDWQFNRALRAEVRDPAWMLARQWQVGEFRAENRASPASAQIEYEITKITHYKPGHMADSSQTIEAYNESVPMEVKVEREIVPVDLNWCLQTGQYWMKLFLHNLNLQPTEFKILFEQLRVEFAILQPANALELAKSRANVAEWQMFQVASGRTLDGEAFYKRITSNASWFSGFLNGAFPGSLVANVIFIAFNTKILPQFIKWYNNLYSQPDSLNSAWDVTSLEYKFKAISSQLKNNSTHDQMLVADDYTTGRLDWYSFDAEPEEVTADLQQRYGGTEPVEIHTETFFPTNLDFPGAPNSRWWEFEDSKLNVGKISIDSSDLGRMLFLDFKFLYNSDWFTFPITMKTGSICKIKSLRITDVFGRKHNIKPSGEATTEVPEDWGRWSMFALSDRNQMSKAERRVFLPPALVHAMEGEPLEKVSFFRDDMAEMAWGVEQIIPNGLGRGMNGSQAAAALSEHLKNLSTATPVPAGIESDFIYKLANDVPENWIPLIPTKEKQPDMGVQYFRSSIPRTYSITGNGVELVEPRGEILKELGSLRTYIKDEEISRSGTIVKRAFQRTRWFDGKTYVWLGRQKTVGQGEGRAGLVFDQLIPVEKK